MSSTGEGADGCLLSILIATLDDRRDKLARISEKLRQQIAADGLEAAVEILVESDDGTLPTGAKRNTLTKRARGEYVVSVDDDDDVHDRYVPLIVAALRQNPGVHVVGIRGEVTFRDGEARTFVMSNRFSHYRCRKGIYERPPHHLNPIRRDVALRFPFEAVYKCEDSDQALRMARARALPSEVFVEEVLYRYRWRRSMSYQRLLDMTEFVRHPLGIQMWNILRLKRWLRGGAVLAAPPASD